jgi:transcriptional regulator with XRE-family HTH domain
MFAERLKTLRLEAKLTQKEIAQINLEYLNQLTKDMKNQNVNLIKKCFKKFLVYST